MVSISEWILSDGARSDSSSSVIVVDVWSWCAMASAPNTKKMDENAKALDTMTSGQPQPKKRGRVSKSARPRIDIDDEIETANKLSTIMKKLSHAAKMSERNSARCKSRLIRRTGKLSAQDLERMATLKRCGLDPDDAVLAEVASSSSATGSGTGAAPPVKKKRAGTEVMKKLASLMIAKQGAGPDVMNNIIDIMRVITEEEEADNGDGAGNAAGAGADVMKTAGDNVIGSKITESPEKQNAEVSPLSDGEKTEDYLQPFAAHPVDMVTNVTCAG